MYVYLYADYIVVPQKKSSHGGFSRGPNALVAVLLQLRWVPSAAVGATELVGEYEMIKDTLWWTNIAIENCHL